jgi:hypothetical protein
MLAAAVGAVLTGSAAYAAVVPFSSGGNATMTASQNGVAAGTYQIATVVPTDTGALAADPSLSQYTVFDLQVQIDSGDHWAGADLRAQLLGGAKFYIPPANDSNTAATAATRNANPYLRDDTMVFAPGTNGTRATILGSSSRKVPPDSIATFPSNGNNFLDDSDPNGTATLPANDMMLVDVQWGDTGAATNNLSGVQTIARLVVKTQGVATTNGVWGTVVGKVTGTSNPGTSNFFTFLLAPAGVVPEPTSVALMGLGLGAVALRRRVK